MYSIAGEESESQKRVLAEAYRVAQDVVELRVKFQQWGFDPAFDRCVEELARASGYSFFVKEVDGEWKVKTWPPLEGKFDLVRAKKALGDLSAAFSDFMLKRDMTRLGEADYEAVKCLANRVFEAATASLEKHGDLRDAGKELGDCVLRDETHPNADNRDDLWRIITSLVEAREAYKHSELVRKLYTTEQLDTWFDERVGDFMKVAARVRENPECPHTMVD